MVLPNSQPKTLFLTDSGMETTFIFHDLLELREFAAFELATTSKGQEHLRNYYRRHVALANEKDDGLSTFGFVFESVTWRCSLDWLKKLGYDTETTKQLQDISNQAIAVMKDVHKEYPHLPVAYSGCVGPRGDGYVAEMVMSIQEAKEYHLPQVEALHKAGADLVTGVTMNYINEAVGIAKAAQQAGVPVVLSFTCETNGCLVTGESLQHAIETVDKETGSYPSYYMVNCAHPTHFIPSLQKATEGGEDSSTSALWTLRIGGIRANASKLSHDELDDATELDEGNPMEFGQDYTVLCSLLPNANVFGGCCGTNHKHVQHIRDACASRFRSPAGEASQ